MGWQTAEEAIDVAWWLQDRFDRGKRRRRSSTPAVVPGAAPALAKAGVGGYIKSCLSYSEEILSSSTTIMILLERRSKPWVAFIICAPWTSKARMPWAWGSWNSKHMRDMVWYGHLENYHRVKVNESAAGTVHPTDLCALQDFAARWSAICFDLCSSRDKTEMRVTVAWKHRKHRKHRKQCQWRSVETLHSCAMLRVACAVTVWTWSQETWTIRTGEFATKSGRYGTHLDAFGRIWYERNNRKIIPFHRCETVRLRLCQCCLICKKRLSTFVDWHGVTV